ncbi:MAG: 4'-phosphopantetheinyl transferase family protein [Roseiarcus sp.]
MRERAILDLANWVATITDPVAETGCVGAWALDLGLTSDVRLRVIASLADAPASLPQADELFVWFGVPIVEGTALLDAARDFLNTQEQAEALRFHVDADRCSFIAARMGLRAMLGMTLGLRPLEVHISRGRRGKPHLCADWHTHALSSRLHFNISHTRGLVAVALAGRPVGIDIETPAKLADRDHVARSVFAPELIAALNALPTEDARDALFYRFWTLGEAFVKATGLGMSQGFHTFAFTAAGPVLLTRVTPSWGPALRWRFGLF